MDEIDAALDFKNVSIVGNYIKQRTKNAQFIIISLRSNMFELADRLVGIYKTHDCTRCATINPKLYGLDNLELQKKDIGDARERARKRPFSPSQNITSQDTTSSSKRDSNVNVQASNPEVPNILSPCGIVGTPLNEDIRSLEQADNSSDVSMEEESEQLVSLGCDSNENT
uniref:RecF/RecN/SMC N-terminal domain-containing protein n=1 Tax=Timema poppense TaxID=170557 RepID=A0A7R9DMH3_TIMPO|nr:unnamed protein product [Timema poppensis]